MGKTVLREPAAMILIGSWLLLQCQDSVASFSGVCSASFFAFYLKMERTVTVLLRNRGTGLQQNETSKNFF